MQIATKFLGLKDIDEKKIIEFAEGILGFPEIKRYVLFPYAETPFLFLQAVEHTDLCFVLLDPCLISDDYVQEVLAETAGSFGAAEPLIYVLVSVDEEKAEVRVNLQAPIIMQAEGKTAGQTVLTKKDYPVAYVLPKPLKEGV